MKVLVVNPFPSSGGGAVVQSAFLNLLKRLNFVGNVESLDCSCELTIRQYTESAIKAWEKRALLDEADLIIFQSPLTPSIIVLTLYAFMKKKSYIVLPHGEFIPTLPFVFLVRKPFLKWFLWITIIRFLMKRAAAVVLNSDLEKERFIAVGGWRDNLHVIPHVFESYPEDSMTVQKSWVENRPCALFLGRISKEKGLDLLLRCWPEVVKRVPKALLILAGPIEHPEEYKRLMALRLKFCFHDSVFMPQWIGGETKNQLLAMARCVVLPSHFESFGYVVLEAIAAGTPVIVSTGAPWQHLHGVAGYCIPREKKLWVEAITQYLVQPHKIRLENRIIQKNREPYQEQNISPLWEKLIRLSLPYEALSSADLKEPQTLQI